MSTLAAPPDVYARLPADQHWPDQGGWTYADFLRLPDNGLRYEIIAGVLYMTNAPDPEHQYAVGEIFGGEYWIANPRTRFVEVYSLERGEYVLRGEHGPGERLQSGVLPGLTAPTDTLFAA